MRHSGTRRPHCHRMGPASTGASALRHSRLVPYPRAPTIAHVLAVEDDASMRRLITQVLEGSGFHVTAARNGPEMWDALERLPIDLVLLDIMLPGVGGMDLCRALRSRGNMPIIMVTARGAETDRVLGLELGADDYLAK